MPDEDKILQKYQIAIETMRYEGQLLWQIFNAFLLAHTVFMAFLLQAAFNLQAGSHNIGSFIAGVIGILLCIPWMATYQRSSEYYIFRMIQAREAEPDGWGFLKDKSEDFSAGKAVQIGNSTYRVNWLARVLRTKRKASRSLSRHNVCPKSTRWCLAGQLNR